jgi:hypothetical protein
MAASNRFEFRCSGPSGEDVCFNNGTCSADGSRCSCPPDYTRDYLFYHFDNCAAYKGHFVTWIPFASLFTVIWLGLSVFLVRLWFTLKGMERRLAAVTLLAWGLTELFVVTIAFQEGCYEACAFFASTAFALDYYTLHFAVILMMRALQRGMLMKSASSWLSPSYERAFASFTYILMLASVTSGAFMLAFTRDANTKPYNIATLSCCIVLWIAGMFFCVSIVAFTRAMERRIDEAVQLAKRLQSSNSGETSRVPAVTWLRPRLRALRLGSHAVGLPFVAMMIAVPLCLFFEGSIPYYFVLEVVHFIANTLIVVGIVGFLRHGKPKIEVSSDAHSNNQILQTPNGAVVAAYHVEDPQSIDASSMTPKGHVRSPSAS